MKKKTNGIHSIVLQNASIPHDFAINDLAFSVRSLRFSASLRFHSQSVFISVNPWLNFLALNFPF